MNGVHIFVFSTWILAFSLSRFCTFFQVKYEHKLEYMDFMHFFKLKSMNKNETLTKHLY